jgi:hypothetical protein
MLLPPFVNARLSLEKTVEPPAEWNRPNPPGGVHQKEKL